VRPGTPGVCSLSVPWLHVRLRSERVGAPCAPALVFPLRSYLVILLGMKTAISVPDETFEKASRRAHDLGMSRSEFFSRAAARYLDELDAESVTRQIDLAVAAQADQDDSAADAVVVGRRVLADASGDW
jgi:hypothetical protein